MPTGDFRPTCELCQGTGYYGDNGPGTRGNREYQPCDACRPEGARPWADVLRRALDHWGVESQIAMVAEESAELAAAAMHLLRHSRTGDAEAEFCDEMADVEIMLDQMKVAGYAKGIAAAKAKKMDRLEARLNTSICSAEVL